jgi:ABC-type branched-subunit amino acid transport system ATPase component
MTGAPLLAVDQISMRFGGLQALDKVSLTVTARQVVGLIGPNGSGKSTLINVLSRIYDPTEGRVQFDSRDIAGVPVHGVAALGIARTFQNVRLFATMTVRDNLILGATSSTKAGFLSAGLSLPAARREDKAINQKAEGVASLLGLDPYLARVAGDLPYGLQKLVELGRALVSDPRLVLLDEPVAGMNSGEKEMLKSAFARVREARDVAFLLVEHDMSFVMSLTEYLYVLDFGKLIAEGTPDEVKANPLVIEAYLGGGSGAAN